MSECIDKDELLTTIGEKNGRIPLWLDEILMECKAVDVAPVVRCKDCEHWGTRKADGYGFCCIWGTSVEGNAFCSSGVKRRT